MPMIFVISVFKMNTSQVYVHEPQPHGLMKWLVNERDRYHFSAIYSYTTVGVISDVLVPTRAELFCSSTMKYHDEYKHDT